MGSIKKTETGSVLNFNTYLPKTLDETKISFTPQQKGSGTPSPENVREIVGKNGITVWQSNKGVFHNLPSAYQEVEYIEGTGTQKIDTGIVFNDSDFNVSCRFVLPEYYGTSEYPVISIWIGVRNYWNCFVRGSSNRRMSVYTSTHHQPTREVNEGEINDISLDRTDTTWTFTHNEETINWTYSPTSTNETTLKVFTRGDGNAASHIRVYSLTVEVEGELVGDFVPCYRKSDSVAGLYDLVTKTFFTNYADGTNFVVGEDIVGVETSVSFPAVEKNLFNGEWRNGRYIDGVWNNTNTWRTSKLIPVEPNTTYCVSVNEPRVINHMYYNLFDRNGNWIGSHYGTSTTTTADTALMTICNTNNVVSALTDIQLEKGSTATDYEPFDNTVYGGYVDLVNGEVVAEYAKIQLSDLTWNYSSGWSNADTYCVYSNDINDGAFNSLYTKPWVCNVLPSTTPSGAQYGSYKNSACFTFSGSLGKGFPTLRLPSESVSSIEEAVDYIANNNITVAYKLAEPKHYPLSPRILTTLRGNNVMWSDGDSLTISYTDDVVNTYDFRRHISLDTPHKANASGAVASFGTDMVGKMKCKIHFSPKQEGSGTPSPDNVRNISGRSSVKLWQSGKNIYSGEQLLNLIHPNFTRYSDENGEYGNVGTGTSVDFPDGLFKENTQYTFILKTYSNASNVWGYSIIYADGTEKTITFPSGVAVQASVTKSGKTVKGIRSILRNPTRNVYYNESGVFEGACTVDDFEPYKGLNEITFSWDSDPEIGTIYGGYVDCETADLVVEYAEKVITGDENWQLNAWNGNGVYMRTLEQGGTSTRLPFKMGQAYGNMLSYNYNGLNPVVDGSFAVFGADTIPNYTYLIIYNTAWGTTLEEYKAKLKELYEAGTPLTIVAPLKTAYVQHYSLTPQAISTLRGSNRIWSDGDSVEVEYYKHTDEPQEYIPAEVLGTGNIAIVTSDGYLIGEEQDYIKY